MDKKQAYEILNQALSQIQTTRQNHEILIQALRVLSENQPASESK